MHTGEYIRTVRFDKAVRGYNKEDVDTFLSEIADDVDALIEQNRMLSKRLAEALEVSGTKPAPVVVDNSGSIEQVQSILVSAQRFSDQIVNEANEKAVSILEEANAKAREIDQKVGVVLEAFEKEIADRKAAADEQVSQMLSDAAKKSEGIITAAHDSVARQQMLFEKLKFEASDFKKTLFDVHKKQLELLQQYPDSVPYDPERAAKAVAFKIDNEPDFADFIPTAVAESNETEEIIEEVLEQAASEVFEDNAEVLATESFENEEVLEQAAFDGVLLD